jgi:two-component system, NtrC family, response regulator AtoC
MNPLLDILLADDEPSIRLALGDALVRAGHRVKRVADGAEALAALAERSFDLVVSDISMPKVDGIALFRHLRVERPDSDVILITAHGKLTDAITALKEGALDYVTKPFDQDELLLRVQRVAERRALGRELSAAKDALSARPEGGGIVGRSPVIVRALERVDTIAGSEAPVMVLGESGTGKELVARRIHAMSARAGKPFLAVNCASFPETLIEAELFGYERGAFTGAMQRREGRFKAADGGTLFLDEVAEIPITIQAKLLRVLQEGEFEPIGSNTAVKVNVRVVSATHRNLKKRISENLFREDLYYRLNVLDVHLPPLRDRRGDLPILIEHFLKAAVARGAKAPTGISPRAFAALSEYPFPGNVRELQHAVEHAAVLARGGEVEVEHLPRDIVGMVQFREDNGGGVFRHLSVAAKEFEREYLLRALAAASGKKGKAAELLGISRKNLWEKLRAHELSDSDTDE